MVGKTSRTKDGAIKRNSRTIKRSILVFLAVAVFISLNWFLWPLLHWFWFDLVWLHPVGSLAVLLSIASLSTLFFPSVRLKKLGIGIFLFILVASPGYYVFADALTDYYLVSGIQPKPINQLPPTGAVRYVPRQIAETYGSIRTQNSMYSPEGFEPLDLGTDFAWVAPLTPNGHWNKFVGGNNGVVIIRNDEVTRFVDEPLKYGVGTYLFTSVTNRLIARNYGVEYPRIYYHLDSVSGELLEVCSYIGYRFQFPVWVPYWAGVAVVHGDGTREFLSPEAAQSDPRLAGQRLFPEKLAGWISSAWASRNGIMNAWFVHDDQVKIPRILNSLNQMPYMLPSDSGPVWFVAAEPYGPASAVFKIFWFDARSGELSLYEPPVNASLIGPNRALEKVISSYQAYNWDVGAGTGKNIPIEPRPFVKNDGRLYWMVTVTTRDYVGINHTDLVDSVENTDRAFQNLQELQDFQKGIFAGRPPTGPTGSPQSLGELTDKELIENLGRISDELKRRQN